MQILEKGLTISVCRVENGLARSSSGGRESRAMVPNRSSGNGGEGTGQRISGKVCHKTWVSRWLYRVRRWRDLDEPIWVLGHCNGHSVSS